MHCDHSVDFSKMTLKISIYNFAFFVERCSPYSSGHAFHSFIYDQCGITFMFMILTYPFVMVVSLRFNIRFQVIDQFGLTLVLFFCLIGSCVCIQIISALTCRPFEILFDLRFISILTTQLFGFIGCLLFAYKFGSIFAIKIPQKIFPKNTLSIPLTQSFIINLK
jgi:hypothetical protein